MAKDADPSTLIGSYPTCATCGGEKVVCDAWASWNRLTLDWSLSATFDHLYCNDCTADCRLEWHIDDAFRTKRIQRLNDAVRHGDLAQATVVVTIGVKSNGEAFLRQVGTALVAFNDFSADNDPHGEHDFGALEIEGQKLFWKIDYFDRSLEMHSPDAANPDVTHRVLTIMLASEY